MYARYCSLRDEKGVTDAAVARATGIPQPTFTDWKKGRSAPKREKLVKIAEYFGVPVEYLITGKHPERESDSGKKYYFSDEAAEMAQEIFENKDLRALFDATRKLSPEMLRSFEAFARAMKESNPDG